MLRIVIGSVLLVLAFSELFAEPAPNMTRSDQLGGAALMGIVGAGSIYSGRRARSRTRREQAAQDGPPVAIAGSWAPLTAAAPQRMPMPGNPSAAVVGDAPPRAAPKTRVSRSERRRSRYRNAMLARSSASVLDEKVGGAIDITRWDWVGLAWEQDHNTCSDRDWRRVLPGTYYLDRIDRHWIYVVQGNLKYKIYRPEFEGLWPRV